MAATKTDNHYTADKVALRVSMTEHLAEPRVLDVFGGHGVVWAAVTRQTGKRISRVAVDNRLDLFDPHLHGDNTKIVKGLDLSRFDVVDLDAYGIPAALIHEVVVDKRFKGVVFVTAIQTMHGGMPKAICEGLGLPQSIFAECPSLVARRGWEFFKAWLATLGIREIIHRSKGRKHYLGFFTGDRVAISINDAVERAADCDTLRGDISASRA